MGRVASHMFEVFWCEFAIAYRRFGSFKGQLALWDAEDLVY